MLQIESAIGSDFSKKVIPLIENAKNSIKIMVFDWLWYPNDPGSPVQQFNHAILTAKNRGVEVQVITNIDAIIKILNSQGCFAKRLFSKRLVHVKMLIVDGRHLVLGSHNYTQRAFTMNFEASIILKDFDGIHPYLDFFNSSFL